MLRKLICIVLLALPTPAWSIDPILLLLLRVVRDQIITSALQAGVESALEPPPPAAPTFGYALPISPVEKGTEGEYLRSLIDESFLHLSSSQRAAVLASVQAILRDPRNAAATAQIVAEFSLTARRVREGYRQLDSLSHAEKRKLAAQAREEFRRLPPEERQQLLEAMQTGMLPVPRDLSDIMRAEFASLAP
jgi:hypothetical protein